MPARMPCSISEGPQEPDDAIPGLDDLEDDAYERTRQESIDGGDSMHNTLLSIARSAAIECPACSEIALEAQRIIRKHVFSDRQQPTQNFTMYECSECGIETAFTGKESA